MRVVQRLFNTHKFVELNSRPEICRTMIVGLRPRVTERMIEKSTLCIIRGLALLSGLSPENMLIAPHGDLVTIRNLNTDAAFQ